MINFIGAEAQIGHLDRQLTTVQTKTGANEADKMKNIYDLEGNNSEWTAQANNNATRAYRGGCYGFTNNGSFNPVSYRSANSPNTIGGDLTSRVSLYVSL